MARSPSRRYKLTHHARSELRGIWRHIASEGGAPAARRVIGEITQRFRMLGEHPQAGRAREEIAPGLRSFPVSHYLIVYAVAPPGVSIVSVWDNRQDPERLKRAMRR